MNLKRGIQAFDRAAVTRDKVAVLAQKITTSMLQRLALIKINPQRILDIGCGTGIASRLLEKHFRKAQIYSLDFSKNMLKQAQKQQRFFSHQRYICADAEKLPFTTHSIDFIFSNLMLHWAKDLKATLSEWLRVLKPEGLLMFSIYGPDTLFELRQSFSEIDNYSHILSFLDIHDVGDALLSAGFINPVMDVETYQLNYASVLHLVKELKQLGEQNRDPHQQKTLMGKYKWQTMLNAYEKFRLSNTKIPATFEIIYGHGWGNNLNIAVENLENQRRETLIPLAAIKKVISHKS